MALGMCSPQPALFIQGTSLHGVPAPRPPPPPLPCTNISIRFCLQVCNNQCRLVDNHLGLCLFSAVFTMDPRDDTIGYGTEESTNSGTDPDMPPLVDGKPIVRSWSNGEVEVRSSVATREAQVQFRCQLRRRAKSAGCFFHRGISSLSVG